jgi:hypothetical protein
MRSIQKALDLHFSLANAVRLEPMNFGGALMTLDQSNRGHPLALSPATRAISLPQDWQNPYLARCGDRLDLGDRPDNLEVHGSMVSSVKGG